MNNNNNNIINFLTHLFAASTTNINQSIMCKSTTSSEAAHSQQSPLSPASQTSQHRTTPSTVGTLLSSPLRQEQPQPQTPLHSANSSFDYAVDMVREGNGLFCDEDELLPLNHLAENDDNWMTAWKCPPSGHQ